MAELTKERLERVINLNDIYDPELTKSMARQLLASMEQEPVGWMTDVEVDELHRGLAEEAYIYRIADCASTIPLYAAPQLPQPAVPEDAFEVALSVLNDTLDDCGDSERGLLLALDRMGIEVRSDAVLQGAEPVQVWIPCSERMPDSNDDVLCATEFDGPGDWRKKVGYWHEGKWMIYGASWTPTHWIPLPAAPQQEVR